MRNQTWNQTGQIVQDRELFEDLGILKVRDKLTGIVESPTVEDAQIWSQSQRVTKRSEARARAVQAIKDNDGASPWGKILNDMAIAEGWIEPV